MNANRKVRFKTVLAVIAVVLAAVIVAAPWLIHAIAGDNTDTGEDTLTEKRDLAEFPKELSNDWFARVETYFTDHSPARNRLIGLKTAAALKKRYKAEMITEIPESLKIYDCDFIIILGNGYDN